MNIKTLIIAIAFIANFNLSAGTVEPTIIPAVKSFTVDLNDWADQDAMVSITNKRSEVLVSDRIHNQSGRIYNLKNLSNGDYVVTVSNDLKIMNTTLEISEDSVIIKDKEFIYKPIITTTPDFFDVSVLTQGSPVVVEVINNNGNVFRKEYTNTQNVNKRFSYKDLPEGQYYVSVTKGNININVVVEK